MGEIFERDVRMRRRIGNYLDGSQSVSWPNRVRVVHLGDVVMEPLGALFSSSPAEVSIVVARHVFEDIVHTLRRNLGEQRFDEVLMR